MMSQSPPAVTGPRRDLLVAHGLGPWHVAVALAALPWLLRGPTWALAAVVGGLAVVAGAWLSGRIALGGGVQSSGGALGRLLAGMMLKWVVVIGALALGMASGLSPLPVLTGVIAALVAQMLAVTGRAQASKAI
ncbi:MAG: ATP synthase subunit I [Xanthomonadales bacterium]|nr:ATP synthase subunit I [Xanthomonadales bacterium]